MRFFLVLLVCLGAASASAAERALVRAERLFDALEFDSAAAAFEDALREPGTRQERIRAWRGLALSEAFMGQAKQAQAHFETLLSIEPEVDVSRALGPKIRRPYEAARKKMQNRPRAALKLVRRQDGQLEAVLEQPPAVVTELSLYVRQPGESGFTRTQGASPGPVVAPAPAVRAVEAYAQVLDAADGVLFEQGSAEAPMRFDATEERLAAVAGAQEPTRDEGLDEGRRPVWPWVVGGVGLVAAGVVAGVVLSQPPALNLPAADRTGRLP
ncbi:hypothetical protein [Hyalangium rubrum]|uniref:Tetratricopeptide repeat protein n=1 Tax=Hyalangium rubrum TaxID=3103134 RepID=A0ABU5HI77_9BACT|nr:hypothetical protein [Hyalangium sp. s54d21]MDY7233178.1 hypothetical protein [Hyalangium sp. s54d21]